MSEQYFQRPEDEHDNSHIDDPLAELARIVTGNEIREESASIHQKPKKAQEQDTGLRPPVPQSVAPSITPKHSDTPSSASMADNPFAKFVVKPVEIKERPRKIQEDKPSADVKPLGIFTKKAPQEKIEPPVSDNVANELSDDVASELVNDLSNELVKELADDVADPFADIDLEFPELLEAGLSEEENQIITDETATDDGESDGMDLESQLMAELNGEEEVYHTQYSENLPSDNHEVAEEPVPEIQAANLSISSEQQLSDVETSQFDDEQPFEQVEDEVGDPETEEFLRAFAAEDGQVAKDDQVIEQDFEASLEQRLGMVDEQPINPVQAAATVSRQNSSVQNEIDAVLSSLERPINATQNEGSGREFEFDEQNFGAAFDSGNEAVQQGAIAQVAEPSVDTFVNASMNQVNSALAGSIDTQTELPEFPEAREHVVETRNPVPEQSYSDPNLFQSEQDYAEDERQINESVHALQDDLAAQNDEIENAFSDAFAEEISLDMGVQNTAFQEPQAQMEYEYQDDGFQTTQDQEYQNYAPQDEFSDGYSDDYPPMEHERDLADVGNVNYFRNEQPMNAAERNEMEIDQALAGALRPERKKTSGFKMAAIALGGAVVIGAGVVGYGLIGENSNSDPVLVRANQSDFKVKPDQPGGKEIANQDQPVYVNMNGKKSAVDSQEKLVSSNVKPVDLNNNLDSSKLSKSSERLSNSTANSSQNAANAFVQPRKVKTVTVRADGTIITSEGAKVADLGAVNKLASSQVPVDQSSSVDGAKSTNTIPVPAGNPFIAKKSATAGALNTLKVATVNQSLAADPNNLIENTRSVTTPVNTLTTATEQNVANKVEARVVKTAKVPVEKVKASPLDTRINNALAALPGGYKVQISSQRSQEAAEATYQNLKQKFASLLDGQPKEIRAVNVDGQGIFYRVQIPIGEMPEAASFCKRYKAAGGSCFVTR